MSKAKPWTVEELRAIQEGSPVLIGDRRDLATAERAALADEALELLSRTELCTDPACPNARCEEYRALLKRGKNET